MTVSSYHTNRLIDGLLTSIDQDGTLKAGAVDNTAVLADSIVTRAKLATALTSEINTDWKAGLLPAVSSVTENGNRSADITFASTVASILTPGMRIRTSRTVAAPTGSLTLNGTNQSASRTGTITGLSTGATWTFKIKAKLNSYKTQILAAFDDGSTNILQLYANSSGQIILASGTYANQDTVTSYQSHPLGKFFEVTVNIQMGSTAGEVTMDGITLPSFYTNTAATTFTAASTTFYIGRNAAGNYLDGKVTQCEVFSGTITAATLRSQKNQTIDGTETNAILAYKLDQASGLTDLKNGNNLTANNSPTYSTEAYWTTDANGTPGGTYDWAIVTKVATTVATVQYPEGCAIPTSGGISAVDYSGVKSPFGMPIDIGRWDINLVVKAGTYQAAVTLDTVYNIAGLNINTPVGKWTFGGKVNWTATGNTTADKNVYFGLSTSAVGFAQEELTNYQFITGHTVIAFTTFLPHFQVDNTSATPYYVLGRVGGSGTITNLGFFTGTSSQIIARLAYL